MFDKDNDGFITAEELKEAMQTLGDRLTDTEVSNRDFSKLNCVSGWLVDSKLSQTGPNTKEKTTAQ